LTWSCHREINSRIDDNSGIGVQLAQGTARKVRGRPFAKGNPYRFKKGDLSINRSGRPKSFDETRKLAQAILHRELLTKDGKKISVVEAILLQWCKSKEHQKSLLELAFGKVPDKVDVSGLENKTTLILRYDHERPGNRLSSSLS